jgi:Asp-tRNA(Asn)/Glu-tRNA(Gln) amidotransferase A subunit family amidase
MTAFQAFREEVGMAEQGLLFRSLSDLAKQIRRKDVSPVEVTRAVLDRLEPLKPRLNAFLTNFGEQALEAAKRAEHALVTGHPHGPGPALLMSVISGHDPCDPTTSRLPVPDYETSLTGKVEGLRVGVPREFFFEGLDADVQQAVEQAIQQLRSLGAQVSEVAGPSIRQAPALYAISLAEGAAAHEPWIRTLGEYYGADVRERMQQGLLVSATAYLKAQRLRTVIVRRSRTDFPGG